MEKTLLNLERLKTDIIELDEKSLEFYNFLLFDLRRNHQPLQDSYNLRGLLQIINDLDVHCRNPKISLCLLQNLHHTMYLTCVSDILNDCSAFFKIEKECLYQYRYQILNTMVDMKLIDQIDHTSDIFQSLMTKIYSEDKRTRDWCIVCIRIILENSRHDTSILENIWDFIKKSSDSESSYKINIEILSNFIDFYNNKKMIIKVKELWNIIFTMLNSFPDMNSRKRVIFIIKRIVNYIPCAEALKLTPDICGSSTTNSEEVKTSWNTFTIIFETLDENQSHLILPSLQMLHQINLDRKWIEILYRHLLRHKNSLVLKWIIQYIFEKYKASDLSEELLREFLTSLNNTFLYAEDNITSELFKNFIDIDINTFMNTFALIDWKSVPMLVGLRGIEMGNHNFEEVSDSSLLTIASLIRKLQNKSIRNALIKMFLNLLHENFNKSLNLYFAILKKFYTKAFLLDLNKSILQKEFEKTTIIDIKILEIINNCNLYVDERMIVTFLKTVNDLRDILKCFYFVNNSYLQSLLEEHIQNKYNISLEIYNVKKPYNVKDFITLFVAHQETVIIYEDKTQIEKLSLEMIEGNFDFFNENIYYTSDLSKLKKMFVDSYTTFLWKTNSLDIFINNCEMFLDKGGYLTVKNLCFGLFTSNQKVKTEIIDRLLTEIKAIWKSSGFKVVYDMCRALAQYFINLDNESCIHFITKLLDLDSTNGDLIGTVFEVLEINKPDVLTHPEFIPIITRGLLFGEPLHGDQKIEFDFCNTLQPQENVLVEYTTMDVRIRSFQVLQVLNECKTLHLSLKDHLLDLSRKLNEKKPRYFNNSKQHRLKLRIVQALSVIYQFHEAYDEKYLIAITEENNQLDVTLIMELLIAKSISSENLMILLDKLNTYKNSALPSIFAIAFMSCRFQKNRNVANKIIENILPFTMGQNFNTRFHAQVTIYHLIEYFNFDHLEYLYEAIEKSMEQGNPEQNLQKLNNDFRYNFLLFDDKSLYNEQIILEIIPKMANISTDEVVVNVPCPWSNDFINIEPFEAKQSTSAKNVDIPEFRVTDVQKKVIPIKTELNEELLIYSDKDIEKMNSNDIIVVASLITKAPNLGGIARTCEVLGFKVMTLDSLRFVENIEFKTLSMTAEKWLNLMEVKSSNLHEFLMQKKLEGYSIVGAEQTTNSLNFAHFEFPKRMVLLLGHEKEGIPANLLSLLDYAVEIPQQGMVRSLNVHVTGALFMWEYYKQHLQKKN